MSNLRRGCLFLERFCFCWKFWSGAPAGFQDCSVAISPSPKFRRNQVTRKCLRLIRCENQFSHGSSASRCERQLRLPPQKQKPSRQFQSRLPKQNPRRKNRLARNPHLMLFAKPANALIAAWTRIVNGKNISFLQLCHNCRSVGGIESAPNNSKFRTATFLIRHSFFHSESVSAKSCKYNSFVKLFARTNPSGQLTSQPRATHPSPVTGGIPPLSLPASRAFQVQLEADTKTDTKRIKNDMVG